MNYFQHFPIINYNNEQTRNILKRVKLRELLKDQVFTYFDYQLEQGDQPWILADQYYGDVNRVWLVYLSNDITDPFYDWYMDQQIFDNYIFKKYGSIEHAKSNIIGYKDNDIFYSVDTFRLSTDSNKINWTPIYSYDDEFKKNEDRRSIKLLNKTYAKIAEDNLKLLLKVS